MEWTNDRITSLEIQKYKSCGLDFIIYLNESIEALVFFNLAFLSHPDVELF